MHDIEEGPHGGKAQPTKSARGKIPKALAPHVHRIFVSIAYAHRRISKSRSLSPTPQPHNTTMNCTRCLRTAIQRPIALPFRRAITTTPALRSTASPRQGNPDSSSHTPSAATSTGAAQPFSTPLSASPSAAELQAPSAEKAAPTVKSSVAAGTPLKGLNFTKGKNDPVALEDGEYPSWLWGILKKKGGESASGAGSVEGDLFCMFAPTSNPPSCHPCNAFLFWGKSLTFLLNNSQIQKTTSCSCQSTSQTTASQPRSTGAENSSA
jgi:hypothetical protein